MLSGIGRTFLPKLLAPLDALLVRVAQDYRSGDGVQDGGRSGGYHVDWNLNSCGGNQQISDIENVGLKVLTVHGCQADMVYRVSVSTHRTPKLNSNPAH
jgi:hypothetical protein